MKTYSEFYEQYRSMANELTATIKQYMAEEIGYDSLNLREILTNLDKLGMDGDWDRLQSTLSGNPLDLWNGDGEYVECTIESISFNEGYVYVETEGLYNTDYRIRTSLSIDVPNLMSVLSFLEAFHTEFDYSRDFQLAKYVG